MINSYWAIIATAVLGLCGLIFKTKKDEKKGSFNKLTSTGYVLIVLIIGALLINIQNKLIEEKNTKAKAENDSIVFANKILSDSNNFLTTLNKLQRQWLADSIQSISDSSRYEVTLSNLQQQLSLQSKSLYNIQRMFYPLDNILINYAIEIDWNSSEFKNYKERLDNGIKLLMPTLVNEEYNKKPNDIFYENYPIPYDGKNAAFRIKESSNLFPNSNFEFTLKSLCEIQPYVYFYKKPIPAKEDPAIHMQRTKTFYYENPKNLFPDLSMSFEKAKSSYGSSIDYNFNSKTISFQSGTYSADKDSWSFNGKILSLLDLREAQMFIRFNLPDSNIKLKNIFVNISFPNHSGFSLENNQFKIYKYGQSLTCIYEFPKKTEEFANIQIQ